VKSVKLAIFTAIVLMLLIVALTLLTMSLIASSIPAGAESKVLTIAPKVEAERSLAVGDLVVYRPLAARSYHVGTILGFSRGREYFLVEFNGLVWHIQGFLMGKTSMIWLPVTHIVEVLKEAK